MAGAIKVKSIIQDTSGGTQPLYIGGVDPLGTDAKMTITSAGAVQTGGKLLANSLLAEYTVTGSAITSIDFTGLDINTHKSYRIEYTLANSSLSSGGYLYIYINNDTVNTNYYTQVLDVSSTTSSSARYNYPMLCYIDTNNITNGFALLNWGVNGFMGINSFAQRGVTSGIIKEDAYIAKTAANINITQLTFVFSIANSLAIGSKIRIYRGDA